MTTPQDGTRTFRKPAARSRRPAWRWATGTGGRRASGRSAPAKLAPHLEDAWLILAAVAGPRQGLEYIRKALQVNPQSPRAQRGMEWVMQHLRDTAARGADAQTAAPKPTEMRQVPRRAQSSAKPTAQARPVLAISLC